MRLIALAGPTAVGKSEAALLLAQRLNGEIISVDSMQVYRGLDIGTAKPSKQQRSLVPHHLVDVTDLNETFDAARFVQLASEAITGIQNRGRRPILCGGTGLYFQALLKGLGSAPPADPALRARLEATALPQLLLELRDADPVTFEKIDRQNTRRVIRAVEVCRLSGKPFSTLKGRWSERELSGQPKPELFALIRQPSDLHQRINARVDDMFQRGLVEETILMKQRGLQDNRTASQALGYRQVLQHLAGERGLAETIELVKIRTRQFAKRQLTWFRKYGGACFVEVEKEQSSMSIADRIEHLLRQAA